MAEQQRELIVQRIPSAPGPARSATRRRIMSGLGALLGGSVLTQVTQRFGADAKRKKKKKKRQKGGAKNLKFSDWNDVWFTELDNGVTGIATFEGADQNGLYGTYENEVGSGTLRCYMQGDVNAPCHGFYTQYSDGTSGSITMTLRDKNRWTGTYQIDGGSSGTWSGETLQL